MAQRLLSNHLIKEPWFPQRRCKTKHFLDANCKLQTCYFFCFLAMIFCQFVYNRMPLLPQPYNDRKCIMKWNIFLLYCRCVCHILGGRYSELLVSTAKTGRVSERLNCVRCTVHRSLKVSCWSKLRKQKYHETVIRYCWAIL